MAERKEIVSNCLFEALKAKIKDWNNIEIKRLPKFLNNGFPTGHYYWVEKDSDQIRQFRPSTKRIHYLPFLAKGEVITSTRESFERDMNYQLCQFAKALERKYNFKSFQNNYKNMKDRLSWDWYGVNQILPSKCPLNDNRIEIAGNLNGKRIVMFADIDESGEIVKKDLPKGLEITDWRYSIAEPTFERVN